MSDQQSTADLRLLGLGALAGLLVAGAGMLQQDSTLNALPEHAVASVNDVIISREMVDRTASRVSGEDAQLIQRLVDEELLVQRGVELGMTRSDLSVRQAVIDSLIASVTAEADAASPTDDELAAYLAGNPEQFSYVAKVSAEAWQTDDEPAAQAFISGLRTNDVAPMIEGVERMPDLPDGLMTLDILGSYVGPGIAAAAAEMPQGSSAVFARRGRWLVIRILAREREVVTDLQSIRNRVLISYRRDLADRTLESYLADLRQRADILVANP